MVSGCGAHWVPACRQSFADTSQLARLLIGLDVELVKLKKETGDHWVASAQPGNLLLSVMRLTGRYRLQARVPEKRILVQIELGSEPARSLAGVPLKCEDVLIGLPSAAIDLVVTGPHQTMSLLLDEAAVMSGLAALAPGAERLVYATSLHILPQSRQQLERVTGTALAAFNHPDEPACQLELIASIVDVLFRYADSGGNELSRGLWFQRRPIIQRVEEFMQRNLGHPITLDELCRVARASQRTVEYAFNATYGMGPKQYLALLRLNQVNQRLKSGSAETIMQVAQRYGFHHMGHFSTQYRRLFGETPRQTRQRLYCDASPLPVAAIDHLASL
jgi:AraC-like DNA-binding protein